MSEQTQQTSQQDQGQQGQDKTYTLEGYIQDLKVGTTKKEDTWITFKLIRTNGKKAVSCKAFGKHADELLGWAAEGSAVRVFGKYQTERFTGRQDGRQIVMQTLKVLWSGAPKFVGTELEGQPNEAEAPAAETSKEEEPVS